MKTQLQYPNGLSITIEHDEQFVPQILEKPGFSYDDVVERNRDLIKERESLRRTVNEFETVNTKIMEENTELRTALENVKILNNDNLATISTLREELKQILETQPAPEIPTRHVSPSQQENFFKKKEKPAPEKKEKVAPKWSKKPCSKCGQLFQPTGARSSVCFDCKQHEEVFAAGNDFTENPE